MASQHATKGKGKYKKSNDQTNNSNKMNFQSFAADIVEQVVKKIRKTSNNKKNREQENFSFSKFREMSVSSDDSSTDN